MKSTSGENYMSPGITFTRDFIEDQCQYKGYGKKTKNILENIKKDNKKVEMLMHAANRLSGGLAEPENSEEINDSNFINYLNPQKLTTTESSSYLDFATYALYRKEQEEQRGNSDSKENADKINEEIKKIREMMLGDDGEDDGEESDKSGDEDGEKPGSSRKVSKKDKEKKSGLKEIMRIYNEKLNNITWLVSRVMNDFIPEIGINTSKLMENIDGEERMFRKMKDMSELTLVNPTEFGMPDEIFLDRAANFEYDVPIRASGIDQKQFIYLSVDASGSMECPCNKEPFTNFRRDAVAREICLHLIERVKKGICEIYLRIFENNPWPLVHAYDYDSALKMEDVMKNQYQGDGGTSLNNALNTAFKDLERISLEKFSTPEILVITDGEDDVRITKIPEPYRLNYISVERFRNEDLYKLCQNFIEL